MSVVAVGYLAIMHWPNTGEFIWIKLIIKLKFREAM